MRRGYFKTWRKFTDSDLWLAEKFTRGQAWLDLIALTNHTDRTIWIRGVEIKILRGQCARSEVLLSKRWKWSRNKVRRFLNYLERSERIEKVKQHNNNVTSLICIKNYDLYQPSETPNGTSKRHQKDTKRNTNNKLKNYNKLNIKEKEKEKEKRSFSPPTLEEVLLYFQDKGYRADVAEKAFDYYEAGNWTDAAGKPVLAWKQKMIAVWMKPEHKINSTVNGGGHPNRIMTRSERNAMECQKFIERAGNEK